MSFAFSHPSNKGLLGRVYDTLNNSSIKKRKDRRIIFICGGRVKPYSRSLRNRFIKYSSNALSNFRVFLAEAATLDMLANSDKPEFLNVADFETLVAKIADVIIIFPESAGSYAELGFFTNSSEAAEKTLVVNDMTKQRDSFINIGLLDKLNATSTLKPAILIDIKKPDFNQIKFRLSTRFGAGSRKTYRYNNFKEMDTQEQLYMTFQMIYIFRALSIRSVIYCIQNIFGDVQEKKIKQFLSILVATGYLKRSEINNDYFLPENKVTPFLEIPGSILYKLQASATLYYKKYHLETYDVLREVL